MSKDDVPEWAWRRVQALQDEQPWDRPLKLLARYIAQHEEPPVDRLRAAVCDALDWWDNHTNQPDPVGHVVRMLRARGVTVDPAAALAAIDEGE